MKDGIECVMKSVDEPQLEEGLKAIHNQIIPFAKFTQVNNVCPESKAINQLLDGLEYEWSLWLDGDMILYPYASTFIINKVKKLKKVIETENDNEVKKVMHIKKCDEMRFGLFDPFLGIDICCCILKKSDFVKQFKSENVLNNDGIYIQQAKEHKRKALNYWKKIIVGTHFDNPTDMQVFARFYSRGVKEKMGHPKGPFKHLNAIFSHKYRSTGNKQYKIAKEGYRIGLELGHYPTSHNIDFDMELYDKWKNGKL